MVYSASIASKTLVTTYLEMNSRAEFKPAFVNDTNIRVEALPAPDVNFYLFLYRSVGESWQWRDRLLMPKSQLKAILADPRTHLFVLYVNDEPAGYVELYQHNDDEVEIAYFGLFSAYIGRGLGKHLLSYGIERAWELGPKRVWVHTCNLDGPHALMNYQKRGLRIYKTHQEPMPERYL